MVAQDIQAQAAARTKARRGENMSTGSSTQLPTRITCKVMGRKVPMLMLHPKLMSMSSRVKTQTSVIPVKPPLRSHGWSAESDPKERQGRGRGLALNSVWKRYWDL